MGQDSLYIEDVVESGKIGPPQILVIALCALVMFVDGFDTQTISYAVPYMATQWHLPRSAFGPLFSSALFGLMVGYLAISPLSPRIGHKRLMTVAWVWFSIFTLVTAFARDVNQVMGLRFLAGIGLGTAIPSAIALTSEFMPTRIRSTAVMLVHCGYSLGFVAAGFVSGSLLSRFHWGSLFIAGGALPLVLTILLVKFLPESLLFSTLQNKKAQIAKTIRSLYPQVRLSGDGQFLTVQRNSARNTVTGLLAHDARTGTVLLWILVFLNLAVFYFIQSWLPTMLGALRYDTSAIVWITSLTTLGGICPAFIMGPVIDRIGPYRSLAGLYLLGAVSVCWIAASLTSSLASLLIAAFLAGFSIAGAQKASVVLAIIFYPPHLRATGVGWSLGMGRLGGIVGPIAAGLLYTAQLSEAQIFRASAVPAVLAAVVALLMGSLYRSRALENASAT